MKHIYRPSIKSIRFITAVLILITAGLASASACEMTFRLIGADGTELRMLPGSSMTLDKNTSYSIRVEFIEDHRNCKVPPSDTLFMLNDEKWRLNKETQPLLLTSAINWTESSKTLNTAVISFKTQNEGSAVLHVIRDCSKGGYNESFTFTVK